MSFLEIRLTSLESEEKMILQEFLKKYQEFYLEKDLARPLN